MDTFKDAASRAALKFGKGLDEIGIDTWVNDRSQYIHNILHILHEHRHTHVYVPDSSSMLINFFKNSSLVHCYPTTAKIEDWKCRVITQRFEERKSSVDHCPLDKMEYLTVDTSSLREDFSGRFSFDRKKGDELVLRCRTHGITITLTDEVIRENGRTAKNHTFNLLINSDLPQLRFALTPLTKNCSIIKEDEVDMGPFAGDSTIPYELLSNDCLRTAFISNDSLFRTRARNTLDCYGHKINKVVTLLKHLRPF